MVALEKGVGQFERGRTYMKKEVNRIPRDIFDDYVSLWVSGTDKGRPDLLAPLGRAFSREIGRRRGRYTFRITPQARRLPALPAGWEVKSSGSLCRITVRPRMSSMVKRFDKNALQAFPCPPKRGGRSPMC